MSELHEAATQMMATIVKRCDRETDPKKRAAGNAMYEVCRQWLADHPEESTSTVTRCACARQPGDDGPLCGYCVVDRLNEERRAAK